MKNARNDAPGATKRSASKLAYAAAIAVALTGCAAILDVPELRYTEDAGASGDAAVEAATPDGGGEAGACNPAEHTDKENDCGCTGRGCGGGECAAGVCQPVLLGTVQGATLTFIEQADDDVFVSTSGSGPGTYGIWRLKKTPPAGGPATPDRIVDLATAADMKIVSGRLYFVGFDARFDGKGAQGGLYSCVIPPEGGPCTWADPWPADEPFTLIQNKSVLYFSDATAGIRQLETLTDPAVAPTTDIADYGPYDLWTDGNAFFGLNHAGSGVDAYTNLVAYQPATQSTASTADNVPNGQYQTPEAYSGRLGGDAAYLYFTAYAQTGSTKGTVARVPRPDVDSGTGCSYGGASNARPRGLYLDVPGNRIYWTNLGGPDAPYDDGAVFSCPLTGDCCATPTKHWMGPDEAPSAVTVDDKAIYWVGSQTGNVWKLAKP